MGQRTFQFVSYQSLKRDTFITLDYNFMKMERRHLNWWNIAHQLQSLLCPQYLWEQFYFILGVIVQPWNYSALTNNAYFTHMPTRAGCESLFISISYQKFRSSNSFATVARCVFLISCLYHFNALPYIPSASTGSVWVCSPKNTKVHINTQYTKAYTVADKHTRTQIKEQITACSNQRPCSHLTSSMLCSQHQLWRESWDLLHIKHTDTQHWHREEAGRYWEG